MKVITSLVLLAAISVKTSAESFSDYSLDDILDSTTILSHSSSSTAPTSTSSPQTRTASSDSTSSESTTTRKPSELSHTPSTKSLSFENSSTKPPSALFNSTTKVPVKFSNSSSKSKTTSTNISNVKSLSTSTERVSSSLTDATSKSSTSTPAAEKSTSSKAVRSSSGSANDFMASLSSSSAKSATSDLYHMSPVHVVQARVQSDMPVWSEHLQRFVSSYYDDANEAYVGLMDSVNTASVEGALMYVQAEGINYDTRSTEDRCTRKNDIKYIVFYEIAIAQTNESIALFGKTASQHEYGTMLAMDAGRCTPSSTTSSGEDVMPTACYYLSGEDGEPEVGPFVGGTTKETDPRAPYPNNVWYSYPNSCPLKKWGEKASDCRAATRKGLCDIGVMPDGVTCTFAYRVLGFIPIDDLVEITSMESNTTGKTYADFAEFCEDGGIEFQATADGEWIDGISFWENPQDEEANAERALKLVEAYYNLTNGISTKSRLDSSIIGHMLPLPSPKELAAENPPCYRNVEICNSRFGCMREFYGSTCTVCNSTSDDCDTPPSDWTFPTLAKAVGKNGGTGDASADGSLDSTSPVRRSSSPVTSVSAVLLSTQLVLVAILLS